MIPQVNLLGIHGQIGQGKSAFFQTVQEELPHYYVVQEKFAEPVYAGVWVINPLVIFEDGSVERLQYLVMRVGWEKAKEVPEVRRLLQVYGTEAGRDIHGPECWTNIFEKKLDRISKSFVHSQIIVNDDLRFPEELAVHARHGGVTVKLFGPNRRSHTQAAAKHSSENRLPDHLFDYLLWNTGTLEDYRGHVRTILSAGKPVKTTVLGNAL